MFTHPLPAPGKQLSGHTQTGHMQPTSCMLNLVLQNCKEAYIWQGHYQQEKQEKEQFQKKLSDTSHSVVEEIKTMKKQERSESIRNEIMYHDQEQSRLWTEFDNIQRSFRGRFNCHNNHIFRGGMGEPGGLNDQSWGRAPGVAQVMQQLGKSSAPCQSGHGVGISPCHLS